MSITIPFNGRSTTSKVSSSPSMSEPEYSTVTDSSSNVSMRRLSTTGRLFTGVTINVKVLLSSKNPSLTVTVISAVPFQFNTGVNFN